MARTLDLLHEVQGRLHEAFRQGHCAQSGCRRRRERRNDERSQAKDRLNIQGVLQSRNAQGCLEQVQLLPEESQLADDRKAILK